MPNYSLLAPQVGWTPNGQGNGPGGTNLQSQVVIGQDITVSFEAVGFGKGQGGRPDKLENLIINITQLTSNDINGNVPAKIASIQFNVNDLLDVINNNDNLAIGTPIIMKLTEFDVCQNGNPMKAIILASQIYAPSSNDPAPS